MGSDLLLIAAVLIWVCSQIYKEIQEDQKRELKTVIDPDPAHIIAFRELEKLREEKLWQKGEMKNYTIQG